MGRRGFGDWKSKLSGASKPAAQAPNPLLASSLDVPIAPTGSNNIGSSYANAVSPQRYARGSHAGVGAQQKLNGRDSNAGFLTTLTIHEGQSNVLLQDGEGSNLIFLGDNENYKVGDTVVVEPIILPKRRGELSLDARVSKRTTIDTSMNEKNAPVSAKEGVESEVRTTGDRTSLVVTLGPGFYKPNQQTKKLFVSIEQSLAELHGLRKSMNVHVSNIKQKDLNNFGKKEDEIGKKEDERLRTQQNSQQYRSGSLDAESQVKLQQTLEQLVADRVEVTVRDQFVSRPDMWHLVQSLDQKTIYKGHQIDQESLRFKIRNIYTSRVPQKPKPAHILRIQPSPIQIGPRPKPQNRPAQEATTDKDEGVIFNEQNSAIVNKKYTRFNFFSKSCQVYCLIEISKEMFDFDSAGFMQAEKMQLFVRSYLERCKADWSTHEIVFILYARLYYPQASSMGELANQAKKYTGRSNLTELDLEKEGVYQQSKNKIFQDVYFKAGVVNLSLDTTGSDHEKFLTQFGQHIQNFPALVNWQFKCPNNLTSQADKAFGPDKAFSSKGKNTSFQLPCELGDSERSNILEVMNLALFNLNNEEVDINLRVTGTQMLILTAGMATYRVNAGIIAPTKSRVLLGGVQVNLVSFAKQPPYPTPLLIPCCSYTNPFEKRKQNKNMRTSEKYQHIPSFPMAPSSIRGLIQSQSVLSGPSHMRGLMDTTRENKKSCSKHKTSQLIDWMQVTFLPHIKLLETHLSSQLRKKSSALIGLSKTPLLTPQYHQFQQARLIEVVFGGLIRRDERLFEPHQMFVKAFAEMKANAKSAQQQRRRLSKRTQSRKSSAEHKIKNLNSKASIVQNKRKQKKFWRIDPDMYQLRQPDFDIEHLMQEFGSENGDDQASITMTEVNESQSNSGLNHTMQRSECYSPVTTSNHSITMRIQQTTSPVSPNGKDEMSTVGFRDLGKLRLRQKLRAYDEQKKGIGRKIEDEFVSSSIGTSLHSSPTKQSPYTHVSGFSPSQQKIPNRKLYGADRGGKTEAFDCEKHTDWNAFSTNILQPGHRSHHAHKHAIQQSVTTQPSRGGIIYQSTQDFMGQLKLNQSQLSPRAQAQPYNNINFKKQYVFGSASKGEVRGGLKESEGKKVLSSNSKKNVPKEASYQRRWGHAFTVFQLSLLGDSFRGAQGDRPYSMSFDQLPELGGFNRRENPFDLALTRNYFDPLCKLMDSFWRQLSDVALLPLTSVHYPSEFPQQTSQNVVKEVDTGSYYVTDTHHFQSGDIDIEQNLCLRLTQNFQVINERGSCDFDSEQKRKKMQINLQIGKFRADWPQDEYYYKMALRDIYSTARSRGNGDVITETLFKDSPMQETVAAFRYLLYNHHTRQLQPKTSQESRLFDVKRIKNLDLVQQDLKEAVENCIKLPQIGFILFYDREEARKLKAASEEKPDANLTEEQEEKAKFEKLIEELSKNLGLWTLENVKARLSQRKTYLQVQTDDTQQQEMPAVQISPVYEDGFGRVLMDGEASPMNLRQHPNISAQRWPQTSIINSIITGSNPPNTKRSSRESSYDADTNQNPNLRDTTTSFASNVPSYSPTGMNQTSYPGANTTRVMSNSIRAPRPKPTNNPDSKKPTTCTGKYKLGAGNEYLLKHDLSYTTGACFHLKLSWLFSKGPTIQARFIKRFQRQVKELSNGCFKTIPLSEIVRKLQLNPFESETVLRVSCAVKVEEEQQLFKIIERIEYERQSFTAGGDFSICLQEYKEVGDAVMNEDICVKVMAKTPYQLSEEFFEHHFPIQLLSLGGFIFDTKSGDGKCSYYIEKERGISYLRHNEQVNEITYSENDIVNNGNTDYGASVKTRERVEAVIFALDTLIDLIDSIIPTQ